MAFYGHTWKSHASHMARKCAFVGSPCRGILQSLEGLPTPRDLANLERFGITATKAFGVSMANIQKVAKRVGRDHAPRQRSGTPGVYEARLLTAYVDDPARGHAGADGPLVSRLRQLGHLRHLLLRLFDRTPHAWRSVDAWARGRAEFVRRAAFALLASLAVHDKGVDDEPFAERLPLIEAAASDERHLVRKGVSWALRTTGRRNEALHAAALALAKRLAVA